MTDFLPLQQSERLQRFDSSKVAVGKRSEFQTPVVADFFSGCGGTSAGLRAAGMEIAFGLDFDEDAAKTFRLNFPRADFFQGDITDANPEQIAAQFAGRTAPLLVTACAPCQPFSGLRGTQKKDGRRTLLLRMIPFIERLSPELILVENVPGLKARRAPSGTFSRFCKALRKLDYHVSFGVVDAQHFGVPQRRKRLIVMASRLGPISLPNPTHGSESNLRPVSTVWDWIGDLPPIAAGEQHPMIPNHLASAVTKLNLERLRSTPPGGGRSDWPSHLHLACHAKHDGHSDVYGRMSANSLAPVLTTKCTSISNGRYGHPFQDRPISVREAACLQTFSRDFVFVGGIRSATRQIGNAVPVLLARTVGEHFIAHLNTHGYLCRPNASSNPELDLPNG